jgi:hypothetical protein
MTAFETEHSDEINCTLTCFDRMIIQGRFTGLYGTGFINLMYKLGVPLLDFHKFVKSQTEKVKSHTEAIAAEAGLEVEYLGHAKTRQTGESKEAYAKKLAAENEITEGLICVLSTVEPCYSFRLHYDKKNQRHEFAAPAASVSTTTSISSIRSSVSCTFVYKAGFHSRCRFM